MTTEKTYTFHVNGMHCNACVVTTEEELSQHPKVSSAKSSLHTRTVEICGDFENMSLEEIAAELTQRLSRHSLSTSEAKKEVNWGEFKVAAPIALGFLAAFVVLQKLGIVNLVDASSVSYGTAFFIGVIASVSTCMAVVGGLVLSISATFAKEGDKVKPQLLFHVGRLIAFFVLGGAIGALGASFALGTSATIALSLIVGIVMLILGINLLDVFHVTKRLQPSMPRFISRHALGLTKLNHAVTPFLAGIATFFLPCGFTQSMQIYTLSTKSFMEGGLTMLAFALGTLPVLALLSFSSFSIQKSSKAGIFFKTAGLVVILFALINIINSLVIAGVMPPVFNF